VAVGLRKGQGVIERFVYWGEIWVSSMWKTKFLGRVEGGEQVKKGGRKGRNEKG